MTMRCQLISEGDFSPLAMTGVKNGNEEQLGFHWAQLLFVEHQLFFIIENEFYNLLIFSLGSSAYSPPQ